MMLVHQTIIFIIFLGFIASAFVDCDHFYDDVRKDSDCCRTALQRASEELHCNQMQAINLGHGTQRSVVTLQLRSSDTGMAANRRFVKFGIVVSKAISRETYIVANLPLCLESPKNVSELDITFYVKRYRQDSTWRERRIYFEVPMKEYLQGTLFSFGLKLKLLEKKEKWPKSEVPTEWRKCLACPIHNECSQAYFELRKAVRSNNKTELRDMAYQATDVFVETRVKQAWQMPALAIHVQGLSGETVEELQAQLREIILVTGLPIDRDMAQCIFEDRIKAGSTKTGLKMAADVFSTHTYASCVIPLKEVCLFAINPALGRCIIAEEKSVFPIVHWIADGGLLQIHAKEKARFIVQPWVASSEEVITVAHLILDSWIDSTCLSDAYVSISMALSKVVTKEIFQKIVIIAERLRLSSRLGSARPWSFTVLVTKTGQQLATKAIVQRALEMNGVLKDIVLMGGYHMRLVSADRQLSEELAKPLELPAAKKSYWVVLNGTVAPALTYILEMLDCIGVGMQYVTSINYTTSSGKKKDMLLATPDNVVIKVKRQTLAIQLAQNWYNLDCMTKMSPTSLVLLEYGHEATLPLNRCIQEERLGMHRELVYCEAYNREEILGAGPSSLFAYPAHLWPESLRARAHINTPSHPVSKPASVKRRVNDLEVGRNTQSNNLGRQTELQSIENEVLDQLESVMYSSFRAIPLKAMAKIARISNNMINDTIAYYNEHDDDISRDMESIQELATLMRSPQLYDLLRSKDESKSDMTGMDFVGGSESNEERMQEHPMKGGTIEHDATASRDTLGFGACGYSTLCMAIMHYGGEIDELNPLIYQMNERRLTELLSILLKCKVLEQSTELMLKLHDALHILSISNWRQVFSGLKSKWLTLSNMMELLRAFGVPHRCWVRTSAGYKCASDFTNMSDIHCYNIMYWCGHFYIHSSTEILQLSPEDRVEISLPAIESIVGGTSEEQLIENEGVEGGEGVYYLANSNEEVYSIIASQLLLRDPTLALMGPTIVTIPPRLRYQLFTGEVRVITTKDMGYGEYNIPMSIDLLNFYKNNVKENRQLVVERRLVDLGFGIELKPCVVANVNIRKGSKVAPVVGTIEMCKKGDNSVWLHQLSSGHLKFYLNPSRVMYDVGYLTFADASCVSSDEVPLNFSAFIRPATVLSTSCEANARYTYADSDDVVWIEVTRDVRDGEILWLPTTPERVGWGLDAEYPSDMDTTPSDSNTQEMHEDDMGQDSDTGTASEDSWGGGVNDEGEEMVILISMLFLLIDTIESYFTYMYYYDPAILINIILLLHRILILIAILIPSGRMTADQQDGGVWYKCWHYRFVNSVISMQKNEEYALGVSERTLIETFGSTSPLLLVDPYHTNISFIYMTLLLHSFMLLVYTSYKETKLQSVKDFSGCARKLVIVETDMRKEKRLMSSRGRGGMYSTGAQLGVEYSSNNAGDGPNFSEMIDVPYYPTEYVDADDSRLRIAFWNTNGHMVRDRAEAVISFISHFRVDIMALSDVRLHARAAKMTADEIRGYFRGASVLNMPTTRSAEIRGGGERMNTMGGTMFIIAPRCTTNIIDKKADPSGLGIVGCVKLKINGKKLCVISMYKPIIQQNAGSSTVVHRLRAFLKKSKISKDPTSYVYDLVSHWINTARRDEFTVILGGDFNADPVLHTSVGNHLRNWAFDHQLIDALRVRLPDGYLTHRCNGEDVSSIDHIYVDQEDSDKVTSACVSADPVILEASDHNAIGISFTWPKFSMRAQALNHSEVLQPPRRVELPHYNDNINAEYAEMMQEWFNSQMDELENTSASEGLYYVMRASVQATKEIIEWKYKLSEHIGFRSSFKGGYSRILCALKLAHRLVLRYKYLFKSAASSGTLRQKGRVLQINFGKAYNMWKKLFPAQNMLKGNPPDDEAYQRTAELMQAIQLERRVMLCHLEDASKELLNMLHGRKRLTYRLCMSERISKMEMLREQRRIGQIFNMINLKDRPSVDVSTLTINGVVISDPEQIHDELTEKFQEWYRMPTELHTEAQKFRQEGYWSLLVQGTARNLDEEQEVESFELTSFYEACKCKVSNTQRDEIAEAVLGPISETEYHNEIRKMTHGKAPGPTGVTANMIKAWPKALHDQVLAWLNDIWLSKQSPDWWNLAHLRPIPKPGEPSLENLRPLGLYEITRKILTAIVIKRVYCQWEAKGLLNPNQHAFRRGLGTTNAIIRLMNVAEDAEERGSQLEVVLWDFRRAFDSIDFNFTRLALIRLGMPMEAMEFLLHMMEENEMWVASPYHMTEHVNTDIMECIGSSFHQQEVQDKETHHLR